MAATTAELRARLSEFQHGERRFRHPLNPSFQYTEGIKAMVETARASWLLDTVAEEIAPLCVEHWNQYGDAQHFLQVEVQDHSAKIKVLRDTGQPALWFDYIEFTDFPEGSWSFELLIDCEAADCDSCVMRLIREST